VADYTRVGSVKEFRDGRGRLVRLNGEPVAVFRRGDRWYAIQDACPHMGASLSDGKLDGEHVVCHWHDWKFELATGQGDRRWWARARVFDVKIEGEDLLLRAPSPPPRDEEQPSSNPEDEDWILWDPDRYFKKRSE